MKRLGPAGLDAFANDPDMLREQGGDGSPLDNRWFFANEGENIALEHDGGCMPFCRVWGYDFDMHFLFPKEMRGPRVLAAAREMLREMFTRYRAERITGTISRTHLAARMVIRQLGFVPVSDSELCGRQAITYSMDKATWLGLQPASTQ